MSDTLIRRALIMSFILNVALFGLQWKTLHDVREFKANYDERIARVDATIKNLSSAYALLEERRAIAACAKL